MGWARGDDSNERVVRLTGPRCQLGNNRKAQRAYGMPATIDGNRRSFHRPALLPHHSADVVRMMSGTGMVQPAAG